MLNSHAEIRSSPKRPKGNVALAVSGCSLLCEPRKIRPAQRPICARRRSLASMSRRMLSTKLGSLQSKRPEITPGTNRYERQRDRRDQDGLTRRPGAINSSPELGTRRAAAADCRSRHAGIRSPACARAGRFQADAAASVQTESGTGQKNCASVE